MSSWCRNHAARLRPRAWALILPLTLGPAASVIAAQVSVQPVITAQDEYDSNLDLDPSQPQGNIGYIGDAAALIGFATPDSDLNVRPRLRYEDYPSEPSLNRLQAMLDLNSQYSSPRSNFTIFGRYDHLNDVEAETPSAVYNDVSGPAPTVSENGLVNLNVTRNNLWVTPAYTYRVTPLTDIGVSGLFQNETFTPADPYTHVPFSYYQGAVSLGHDLGPRADIQLEGYAARYHAKTISSNATTDGGSLNFNLKWSPLVSAGLSGQYQRANINAIQPTFGATLPTTFRGSTNTWSATGRVLWRQQTGQFRLDAGRVITPSSGGGLYAANQAQAEYDRDLSERVTFTGALLYIHSSTLAGIGAGFTRDYHRADLSLKWMLTRTLFLQGGYGYLWNKFSSDLNGATNERAFLQFGYQGLSRQY